ncbi:MAG: DNA primase [Bacteroidota bacterium]|nr:DNA primase [Bacteroidota bacterium]
MRILPHIIDRIIQSADIVEIVGDFVTLKKRGANYAALSPFTNEKTPSFYVSPAKQIFKCFSTGKGGDSIKFLMEIDGLTYVEALKYIAKKYQIELEYDKVQDDSFNEQQSERDALYIVLNYAKDYFKKILLETDEGKSIGNTYFKERGLDDKTIKDFELGFSLDSWDAFLKDATKNQYQIDLLEKAGLVKTSEQGKKFDFFRNRVIFPIHNITGKVIAFTGRILTSDKSVAKYINSPETELYHKSNVLYGLFQAKNAIRTENNCFLVEGNMDVLSLYQAGITNTVASSGTALTEEQVKLIGRYTKNVTVLYDGDKAGINAAIRGTDLILDSGLNIKVVVFPDNEDPDSYVNKVGASNFKEYVRVAAKDFITFKTERLLGESANDPIKKAEVIRDVVQSIAKVKDDIQRSLYFKKCSQLLEIDEQVIISEYNKIQIESRKKQEPEHKQLLDNELKNIEATQPAINIQDRAEHAEKEIVRILIEYAQFPLDEQTPLYQSLITFIENIEFLNPVYLKIIEIFRKEVQEGRLPGLDYFLNHPDKEMETHILDVITDKHVLSDHWINKLMIDVPTKDIDKMLLLNKTIASLNFEKAKHQFKVNQEAIRHMNTENFEDIELELEKLKIIKGYMMNYAKEVGIVVSG